MTKQKRILVTGAGGFIGHHLVKRLKKDGHWVRGADLKLPEYETSAADEMEILDLRKAENCLLATRGGIDEVYNLAADMGGIGYITANHADISRNNILINAHMLEASRQNGVKRFLFSSSACVYNQAKQKDPDVTAAERRRRLSRRSRARLRLGEAFRRRTLPLLLQRLRFRDPHRSLPQRVRAARHLRRRKRKGSRCHLPQSRAVRRWRRDRSLGRWRADPLLHVRG